MPWLLNLAYLTLLFLLLPIFLYKTIRTGKYRAGLLHKFLGRTGLQPRHKPRAWFHAVSVGEVLLLKQVIAQFRERRPDWEVVLSTTTNTGYDVARKSYPDLNVIYWPLDFTWAVNRALNEARPSLLVLAELELWPNVITEAHRRGIPITVVNGRMSPRSHVGYRRLRWFMRSLLAKIDLFAMQTTDYAERMVDLGAPAPCVHVTGSVKYDGVTTNRDNPRTQELARLLGWPAAGRERHGLTWLVGSTQAPEEEIALRIYRRARERFPQLRLLLVPRHQERFEEVASLLTKSGLPFGRRSQLGASASQSQDVVLLDTLGELGAAWGLADVAFVGGSLTPRGGQNMIEPAAYGAAVTFGPNTWNFQDTVERLLSNGAALQVRDEAELARTTLELLANADERARLGHAARSFVLSQQGATRQTLELIEGVLANKVSLVAA